MLFFVCLLFCGVCYGEYSAKCGDTDGFSFEEAGDGVEGRYRLEWCSQIKKNWTEAKWIVTLYYDTSRSPEKCYDYKFLTPTGPKHSDFEENVNIDANCTHMCLSTNLDLIFNATCYTLRMVLKHQKPRSAQTDSCCSQNYHKYVYNNYSMAHFTESETYVNVHVTGDHMTADWYLNNIPATDFDMSMCLVNDSAHCESVRTCVVEGPARTYVSCRLPHAPHAPLLRLRHLAPWCSGESLFAHLVEIQHVSNESTSAALAPVSAGGGPAWWVWAAAAAALLTALALALLWAVRPPMIKSIRKRVEAEWLKRCQPAPEAPAEGAEGAAGAEGEGVKVLLLYARDCAALMHVAKTLNQLLSAAGLQVYDLYSPEVVREAARAGGEWVRRVLARDDVRVLLLQTPAADCLHAARLVPHHPRPCPRPPRLGRPLLHARVAHRAPHCADQLFTLALRLLTERALATQDYRKYYVAAISGLEVELIPEVTPLQRYCLPAAAALLVRDLTANTAIPSEPLQHQVADLTEAVRQLHDFIRQKPDYLDDELLFF